MTSLDDPIPAPWSLLGSGYLLAVRPQASGDGAFLPPALEETRRGHLAWVVFADYEVSDCGPYHELLYVPGQCAFGRRRLPTISRIFVSSQASVVNGRRNWGIPKERCDFEVEYGRSGVDVVRATRAGKLFAEIVLRASGPSLPVTSAIVPRALHTLGQRYEGRDYIYTPTARGRVRPARLLSAWTDPEVFPTVSIETTRFAARVPAFAMEFPPAVVVD